MFFIQGVAPPAGRYAITSLKKEKVKKFPNTFEQDVLISTLLTSLQLFFETLYLEDRLDVALES